MAFGTFNSLNTRPALGSWQVIEMCGRIVPLIFDGLILQNDAGDPIRPRRRLFFSAFLAVVYSHFGFPSRTLELVLLCFSFDI